MLPPLLRNYPSAHPRSLQEQSGPSVLSPRQRLQVVLDVLQLPELARPTAVAELPCDVGRETLGVSVDGDFLVASLLVGGRAQLEPQRDERRAERRQAFGPFDARRPVRGAARVGPPPLPHFPRRPGYAVVTPLRRTRSVVGGPLQRGEEVLEVAYHRYPFSRPHSSQRAAMRSICPASSFGTGSAPVIRVR